MNLNSASPTPLPAIEGQPHADHAKRLFATATGHAATGRPGTGCHLRQHRRRQAGMVPEEREGPPEKWQEQAAIRTSTVCRALLYCTFADGSAQG